MIDQSSKRKQINVRLRDSSTKNLEIVQNHYGLSVTSAIVFLLGAEARRIRANAFDHNLATEPAASPVQPSLTSDVSCEDDEDEIDIPRFGRQIALQHMIDRQQDESK